MFSHLSDHTKGFSMTLFGVLLLSPDTLLVRIVDTDPWTMAFWRGLSMASVIFLFVVISRRSLNPRMFFGLKGYAWWNVALMAIGPLLFINALEYTSVANVVVILSASPFLAAVFSRVLLKESVHPVTWAAVALAVGGTLVVASGSPEGGAQTGGRLGDLLAIGATAGLAMNFTLLRRMRHEDRLPTVVLGASCVAILACLISAPVALTGPQIAPMILLCGLILPVTRALMTLGPRYLPAPEVSLMLVLETVLAPLWVWLALDEVPADRTFIGGAILVSALVSHSLWKFSRARQPRAL